MRDSHLFDAIALSERQRAIGAHNGARITYASQFPFDGKNYRHVILRDEIGERLIAANRRVPGATITKQLALLSAARLSEDATVVLKHEVAIEQAQVFLARNEHDLSNPVKAGENRYKRLNHDVVVRELFGPHIVTADRRRGLLTRFRLNLYGRLATCGWRCLFTIRPREKAFSLSPSVIVYSNK